MTGADPVGAAEALPARRLTAKGAERRRRILDAATELLVSEGHAALTLRGVAARAEIRLGNLQYYFPTRGDLVAALLDRHLVAALDRLRGPLAARDAATLVRLLLDEHLDRSLTVLFTEVWALAGHDEGVAVAVRAFYRRYEELVAAAVSGRRPDLTPTEAAARARVFVSLMEGAALFRSGIAGDPQADSDQLVSSLATGLLE
ncbi:TetR family transcriptional regulator [Actinoplanes sp. NPDC051346]|uniref:TetR/AcrR family transcriptional regulator n=1 Tax=Actinoplanes sp. NPDC051346 TaxID=3155048 RepID=UPI003443718D